MGVLLFVRALLIGTVGISFPPNLSRFLWQVLLVWKLKIIISRIRASLSMLSACLCITMTRGDYRCICVYREFDVLNWFEQKEIAKHWFYSFPDTEMSQVVEILPCVKQKPILPTYSCTEVNSMAPDDLVTQGARGSVATLLTWFSWIFWSQHQNFRRVKDKTMDVRNHIDGLVQDCSISIANAPEILQYCTKPLICNYIIAVTRFRLCCAYVSAKFEFAYLNNRTSVEVF